MTCDLETGEVSSIQQAAELAVGILDVCNCEECLVVCNTVMNAAAADTCRYSVLSAGVCLPT